MCDAVPANERRSARNVGAGRHVQRTDLWADLLTKLHQAWVFRRDRSPLIILFPLAIVTLVFLHAS